MLLLLQLALGLAFLGFLVLAVFDAIRGGFTILTGLILLAVGLTLKGVAFILKQFQPAPPVPPVVPTTSRVWTWKVVH